MGDDFYSLVPLVEIAKNPVYLSDEARHGIDVEVIFDKFSHVTGKKATIQAQVKRATLHLILFGATIVAGSRYSAVLRKFIAREPLPDGNKRPETWAIHFPGSASDDPSVTANLDRSWHDRWQFEENLDLIQVGANARWYIGAEGQSGGDRRNPGGVLKGSYLKELLQAFRQNYDAPLCKIEIEEEAKFKAYLVVSADPNDFLYNVNIPECSSPMENLIKSRMAGAVITKKVRDQGTIWLRQNRIPVDQFKRDVVLAGCQIVVVSD